ncbi:hypothetical protein PVAND_013539 [Polypedilum vanderplanki]|uniref:Adenosine 5'-monophosphoramidase HINT3 n=1 Tax=Polypedilum vanderplanki TaxID=319348 RepID=A0A9J6CQS7_POLVA|nr:hypothetical protein PVAND_013539 [Polypedilum vanderplanki]
MSCVFCDIIANKTNTEILYEDDELVAFRDIKPAASFHFLIIPKRHIDNTKSLTINDKQLLLNMKEKMLKLLEKNNQNDINEISLGFHVPPFNSVKHLHLHGISKKSEMGFVGRWIFKEESFWYKKFDTIFDSLMPPKDSN